VFLQPASFCCRFLWSWYSLLLLESGFGFQPSWCNIVIFASSFHSSFSLVSIFHRWASRPTLFLRDFVCSTRLIQWWESSMDSAGVCWAREVAFTCRG